MWSKSWWYVPTISKQLRRFRQTGLWFKKKPFYSLVQLHNSLVQSTGWDLCLLKSISALKLLYNFFSLSNIFHSLRNVKLTFFPPQSQSRCSACYNPSVWETGVVSLRAARAFILRPYCKKNKKGTKQKQTEHTSLCSWLWFS